MSETILVTLPEGDDVRLEQDGNHVTVWRWADPAPLTDHAAWIVATEFYLGVTEDEVEVTTFTPEEVDAALSVTEDDG